MLSTISFILVIFVNGISADVDGKIHLKQGILIGVLFFFFYVEGRNILDV